MTTRIFCPYVYIRNNDNAVQCPNIVREMFSFQAWIPSKVAVPSLHPSPTSQGNHITCEIRSPNYIHLQFSYIDGYIPLPTTRYYSIDRHVCITKPRLFKYIENFTTKNENFQMRNSGIFHISAQNIDCGYSLEPPRRGGSNEYPQSMFLSRNKKINVYRCKPHFYYIKVEFKGVKRVPTIYVFEQK